MRYRCLFNYKLNRLTFAVIGQTASSSVARYRSTILRRSLRVTARSFVLFDWHVVNLIEYLTTLYLRDCTRDVTTGRHPGLGLLAAGCRSLQRRRRNVRRRSTSGVQFPAGTMFHSWPFIGYSLSLTGLDYSI